MRSRTSQSQVFYGFEILLNAIAETRKTQKIPASREMAQPALLPLGSLRNLGHRQGPPGNRGHAEREGVGRTQRGVSRHEWPVESAVQDHADGEDDGPQGKRER